MSASRFVSIDVETTGLQPHLDRLVEVGAVIFDRSGVLDRFSSLVNPHRSLAPAVRTLTGLTDRQLARAPELVDVLPSLGRFIGELPVVGHGAAFDIRFLTGAGLPNLPDPEQALDTLELARIILPEAPSHSLSALAATLGVTLERAHRALHDAEATAGIFIELAAQVAAMPPALQASISELLRGRGGPLEDFFLRVAAEFPPAPARPFTGFYRPGVFTSVGIPAAQPPPRVSREIVVGLLGAGGVASGMDGFEVREAQLQMAEAVAGAFADGGRLVTEAGTGTGKSLAYLVPAICHSVSSRETVVVATSTINLQEQLFNKDLPQLGRWLPWGFSAALLKGRSNYLCGRRWSRFLAEEPVGPTAAEETRFKLKLLVWLSRTLTGDRAELRIQGLESWLWERVAAHAPECMGSSCLRQGACFLQMARQAASEADLVIGNHDLLLSDAMSEGSALPSYSCLVVDEAHHLEDAATRGLTESLQRNGVEQLLRPMSGTLPVELSELAGAEDPQATASDLRQLAEEVAAAATTLFERLEDSERQVRDEPSRRGDNLRITELVRAQRSWLGARSAVEAWAQQAHRLQASLADLAHRVDPAEGTEEDAVAGRLRQVDALSRGLTWQVRLAEELVSTPREGRVYWLGYQGRAERLTLQSAPVDVSQPLFANLFEGRRTVVLTSATLAVAGSFDFYRGQVGLGHGEDLQELLVASPFDYLRQALVCIPSDFASLQDPDYGSRLTGFLTALLARVAGRTLVLFTSHQQLRDTYHQLRSGQGLDRVTILGQGLDGGRGQVVDRFLASPRAVLLGTSSFWEGVDLPGDALNCVVIQKLPFRVPTEPVFEARSETVSDAFTSMQLPQAALRLKQGFGRLIRTSDDRGAVVLLDNRLRDRAYGRAFLEVLPRASAFVGPSADIPEAIANWLARDWHGSGPADDLSELGADWGP